MFRPSPKMCNQKTISLMLREDIVERIVQFSFDMIQMIYLDENIYRHINRFQDDIESLVH